MYRFLVRPRWLAFTALVAVAVVVMLNLAAWQFRRYHEQQDFVHMYEDRVAQQQRPIEELLAGGAGPDELEWLTATAVGTYRVADQVTIRNLSQGGAAGYDVMTPLDLDDGRVLLVNRGFVPLAAEAPPAPTGRVAVTGRVRTSQERRAFRADNPGEGRLDSFVRIDVERIARQVSGDVIPVYVDLLASNPAEPPGIVPVEEPTLDEGGQNLSYMGQWIIFSIAAVVGWVLAVRRSARRQAAVDH
jgi:cytochrome oxidase assembly protein ShyY1